MSLRVSMCAICWRQCQQDHDPVSALHPVLELNAKGFVWKLFVAIGPDINISWQEAMQV